MNYLLEVRAIRKCHGGHTCNLHANGRKVAFVGPDILEWSSHKKMVDVLEHCAVRFGIQKKKEPKPHELKEGWERETPEYKNADVQEEAQKRLTQWIAAHVEAFELYQRSRKEYMALNKFGKIICLDQTYCPYLDRMMETIAASSGWKLVVDESVEELTELLLKLRKLQ